MSAVQSIGERLRDARERLGFDIAQVEGATKIRAKYLRALEDEQFDLLPGPTFVKTFLRTYAEYLGLDAQLLVEEYRARYEDRDYGVQTLSSPPRARDRQRRAPRGPAKPPGLGTALIVALLALVAIFAILGLTKGGSGGGSTPSPVSHGATSAKGRQHATPAPAHRPPPAPTTVVLRVVPVSPTYVCVDRGQGTQPMVNNVISHPQRFTGKHLRVNAGISSIKLIANGKQVSVPPTNNPIGYDFTPGHVTTIPPGPQRPCIG